MAEKWKNRVDPDGNEIKVRHNHPPTHHMTQDSKTLDLLFDKSILTFVAVVHVLVSTRHLVTRAVSLHILLTAARGRRVRLDIHQRLLRHTPMQIGPRLHGEWGQLG